MDNKNNEFLKRLRETFRIEAAEHVRALSTGLIELEKTVDAEKRAAVIETVFREAHSLKGAARSVNLADIEALCQALEGAFAALKRRDITIAPALLDLFHQTVNNIALLSSSPDTDQAKTVPSHTSDLVRQLGKAAKGLPMLKKLEEPAQQVNVEGTQMQTDTVRVPTAKLGPLLLQAEEMISAKIAANQRTAELRDVSAELVLLNDSRLNALQGRVNAAIRTAEQDQRALRLLVDEHLEAMKKLLMLPVNSLVEVLPKLVRDLARSQGKEVELIIRGAEMEIDKRILEELKDPLIHLLRNCIDHGIKKPEERKQGGKPPCGTISLNFAAKDNRRMEVSVSDDGSGVDLDKVQAAVVKSGLHKADAAGEFDRQEVLRFIFSSGISTSPIITDISGRGLGLAIVREKVESLGGTVSVESRTGVGTTFRLVLPMTLATFRGVLVRVGEYMFILPAINIERVLRVRGDDIKTVENRETIRLDGQILAMARLHDMLELPFRKNGSKSDIIKSNYLPIIVLVSEGKRMSFMVDEILQEQEVLVRGLGAQLKRVRNIAGATVLGTGKVVPMLNVQDLMKSAVRATAVARKEAMPGTTPSKAGRILVAEDSITSRTLLKSILETAGYQVATAVDGADALAQVRSNEFDLVVSDVDMPRMNGFELTTKIRADKKFSELPVVLVTALESRDDKERGIEAGANAYIIKSSFDQSNLLGVIRKFL